jgi:hypothetical protein
MATGRRRDGVSTQKQRALEYMVPLELPVLFDSSMVQPGDEESRDRQAEANPDHEDD